MAKKSFLKGFSERSKGLTFGLLSAMSFGLMSFFAKIVTHQVPSTEVVLSRGLFGVIILSPLVYRDLGHFFRKGSTFLWMRCICGAAAVLCLFFNLTRTSVGDATALSNLSPFFVVLGSRLFLKESISKREWVGVLVVLFGVTLLQSPLGSALPTSVIFIGVSGALFGGAAYLALRQASRQFSPLLVVWGFCAFSSISSFLIPGKSWVIPTPAYGALLLAVGLCGLVGQVFMTYTYILLPAAQACVLNLSSVVWGLTFEALYELKAPNQQVIFCYGVILVGVYLLQTRQSKKRKP